ncbi:MAG: polysaccharide biosynthesis protein [Solirubrobacterales bacterium]|jgi:O-antigen/teichoic acid export membrane protein|nr:polysaccharide biosynthesis protein [Solirubrobacterales bacterium]
MQRFDVDPPVGARRAVADILIQVVGMVGNLGLGVVVTAILARQLGDRGFGQWTTIFAVAAFTTFFTDLGLRQVVIRMIANEPEREAHWLGAQFSLVFVLAIPTAAITAGVLAVISRSHAMLVAGLILSIGCLQAPLGDLAVVFQLRTRNDITTALATLRSVLWGGAVVALSLADGGLVAFAICSLATTVATNATMAVLALRRADVEITRARSDWEPLLRLALPVALAAFLSLAYGRIDQVLVFLLGGSRDAGLYGAAYRVLDQIQFIPVAVLTTLTPLLASALANDRARLRLILGQAATYLSIASLGALAITIAAARPIVRLLFGHEFVAAAPALPVLMGAFVAICFGYLTGTMIILVGLQRRNVVLALVAFAVNIGLNLALIPSYGFKAAAWVTLATEGLWVVLAGRMVFGELGIGLDLRRLPRVVLAAALTGGAVAAVRAAGAGVGVLLAVGVVVYPALTLGLRVVTVGEIAKLLRRDAE